MKRSTSYKDIINTLNLQKEYLGIGHAMLANKTGVSAPTIKRILSGKKASAHFDHVLSLAQALGVDLRAKIIDDAEKIRRQQATQQALIIMKLVRGNAALEGHKLGRMAYKRMLEKTIYELLSGPEKKLWG